MLPSAALLAIATFFIILGHDGRRVAQLLVLFLPAVLWMAWPVRTAGMRQLRRVAVVLLTLAFAADGMVRAYLTETYQSAPDSATVLGALANTNAREMAEYMGMHWRTALLGLAMALGTGALVWRATAPAGHAASGHAGPPARWQTITLAIALLVCSVAWVSKPWRRLHPLLYWPQLAQSVSALQAQWHDQDERRAQLLQRAQVLAPQTTLSGPSTVVLVITDSINRDNMQLYGYGRATTPRLLDMQRRHPEEMLVLRHAWSADASTLPSLNNLFGFGEPDAAQAQHLIAMARTAGYKVWWMSNHDDIAVEQQHARLANVVDMVNRTPGRASASLDGELLDCIQEALADPAERKFIIVHLLGAHPHYRLRFPKGENPFDDEVDSVETQMVTQQRSALVRRHRQEYDAALLYHDFVVAESLRVTQLDAKAQERRAWVYLSDHGQEVGHGENRAGHSPGTEAGYRIPTIVWTNHSRPAASTDVAQRPFRADWAGWTVADILGLDWQGEMPERNVLNPQYRWQPPNLPVQVKSFTD